MNLPDSSCQPRSTATHIYPVCEMWDLRTWRWTDLDKKLVITKKEKKKRERTTISLDHFFFLHTFSQPCLFEECFHYMLVKKAKKKRQIV